MEVIITLLLCAVGFFAYIAYKKNIEVIRLREQLRYQGNLPPKGNFVAVAFEEGATQFYDYLIGNNSLKVGDRVEVPFRNKFTGKTDVKIATVKYVSQFGEQSDYAKSNVIRKVDSQPPVIQEYRLNSSKIFVKVIFEKDAAKSYDYLLGDFEVKVGDFVVVRTSDINSGKVKLLNAQVVYISEPGETSEYAKSTIFKKADHNKW